MRLQLDLLPEEAAALRDAARAQAAALGQARGEAPIGHLERALRYLADKCAHELARKGLELRS